MLTLVNHYHYFDLSPYKIEYDKKDFQPNSVYIYIKYRECFFLCRQDPCKERQCKKFYTYHTYLLM